MILTLLLELACFGYIYRNMPFSRNIVIYFYHPGRTGPIFFLRGKGGVLMCPIFRVLVICMTGMIENGYLNIRMVSSPSVMEKCESLRPHLACQDLDLKIRIIY